MTAPTNRHRLPWMRMDAPYMPVACVGLLEAVATTDPGATAHWQPPDDPFGSPTLTLETALDLETVAQTILATPWPDVDGLDWPTSRSQAIKPTLKAISAATDGMSSARAAIMAWRRLAGRTNGAEDDGATKPAPEIIQAHRLIAALLTDGALDDAGLPGRSRLVRGVKSDLVGVAKPPKTTLDELIDELEHGPIWTSGSSGLGLGLVPEVQTFGGTTGPQPSAVGSYSKLLYRLSWLGILAMPPFAVTRGPRAVVGGPLFSGPDTLSWPVWRFPLRQSALIALFGLAAIHTDEPDRRLLRARGIDAVFRSRARDISTMLSVFGMGDGVA